MIQSVKKFNQLKWNRDTSQYDVVGIVAYILTTTDGEKLTVPLDEANTDYQEILQWVADGNTIEEAD
jgi:hypothetical protein